MSLIHSVLVFSSQSVNSTGTVTSEPLVTEFSKLRSVTYEISTATSGPFVAATISYLVSAATAGTFNLPVDSAGNVASRLFNLVNSNNRTIVFKSDDVPVAPRAQLRLITATANTITFDAVYLTYEETPRV